MKFLPIVLMTVAACVVYGILHDQVTARICVEYFTIGHAPVFNTTNPTLLGLGWGTIATWWVGLLLGIPLACVCRLGPWPKREVRDLVRPFLWLMGSAYALAILAGLAGWYAASHGHVWLTGSLAQRVPEDRHVVFLIDLFAHSASYIAGFVGGLLLMVYVLMSRKWQRPVSTQSGRS